MKDTINRVKKAAYEMGENIADYLSHKGLIKIKNCCAVKDTINRVKKAAYEMGENICRLSIS